MRSARLLPERSAGKIVLKPHNLKELYFCVYHKDTVLFLIPSFSD